MMTTMKANELHEDRLDQVFGGADAALSSTATDSTAENATVESLTLTGLRKVYLGGMCTTAPAKDGPLF